MLPVVESIGYLLPFVAQSLFSIFHLPDVVRVYLLTVSRVRIAGISACRVESERRLDEEFLEAELRLGDSVFTDCSVVFKKHILFFSDTASAP